MYRTHRCSVHVASICPCMGTVQPGTRSTDSTTNSGPSIHRQENMTYHGYPSHGVTLPPGSSNLNNLFRSPPVPVPGSDLPGTHTGVNNPSFSSGTVLTSIDYTKAFNRLSFQHCLRAFAKQGASTPILRLLATFLTGRSMSVRVSSTWSAPRSVSGGCPQGSILGVLLFNITTDDLEDNSRYVLPCDRPTVQGPGSRSWTEKKKKKITMRHRRIRELGDRTITLARYRRLQEKRKHWPQLRPPRSAQSWSVLCPQSPTQELLAGTLMTLTSVPSEELPELSTPVRRILLRPRSQPGPALESGSRPWLRSTNMWMTTCRSPSTLRISSQSME